MKKIIAAALILLASAQAHAHDPIDVSELVTKLLPSVVSISVVRLVDTPAEPGKAATVVRRKVVGTGFVIHPNGLIVTNNHVIAGAAEVSVTFTDGTTLTANILSKAIIDIALLQVSPEKPLTAIKWADSSKVRVGQPVIVIGNALGFNSSVTAGIVSALERDISTTPVDDYIQTDAPLNQGNSGGPLFNLAGEVVGVNTALQTKGDGGSIGIGFSIPSNDVQFVIRRLQQFGRVKPGWVGIRAQQLTPLLADGAGLPRTERNAAGVIVTGVDAQGPAAGQIRPGDVILGVGEALVKDARTFNRSIAILDVGSTAAFDVWRAARRMRVELQIADNPEDLKAGKGKTMAEMAAAEFIDPPDLGLGLAPVNPDIRNRYSIDAGVNGVAVVSVDSHSKASEAGIEPGDVIQRVQSEAVTSVREFWSQVDGARRDRRTRLLLLLRGPTGERWVTLPSA